MRAKIKTFFVNWVNRPEYVYLFLATIGVIGFLLITPPFQGPDEESHYIRAQYIAHGYFIPVNANETKASLPKSISKVSRGTFYADDLRGSTTKKYELGRTKAALQVPLDSGVTYKPLMITYSPLPYLPAIPGIAIANLLNLSPLVSMYIARLSLAAASILIFFLAIKIIPSKKYLLAAVGLIPMMLFQQAVITVDGVSYALLALFLSYVLYLFSLRSFSRRQWILLSVLCIGLVLVKPLIWMFLPLALILFKKPKAVVWLPGIIIVCGLVFVTWSIAGSVKNNTVTISGMPDNVDPGKQISLLKQNPLRAVSVGENTYMTTYGDSQTRGVIGIFGAADTVYPLWAYSAFIALLGIVAVINLEKGKRIISRKWKLFAACLCALYFGLVNAAIYIGFTPVDFPIIYGVQGRYFLPILVVWAILLAPTGVKMAEADRDRAKNWIVISLLILILVALYVTLQRYYFYTP